MWGVGRGSGRRTGRGRRHRADSSPVHLVSHLAGLKDPVHNTAIPSPNRNAFGRSGWHGRKQGNGSTLGTGEAIASPGLTKPPRPAAGFFFGLDIRSRSPSFVRAPRDDVRGVALPLGTVSGLRQGKNLRWSDYRSRSLIDQGSLN